MSQCEQTPGQTILQHGQSVHKYYCDLYQHITGGTPLRFEWRLPLWINHPVIRAQAWTPDELRDYHVFHDCGKPFCRTIDSDGKQHFPNHAEISAQLWRQSGGDAFTALLIEQDMDIHLLRPDGYQEFARRPQAITQILTGLAEVHSNSRMFGGIGSTSFKIKAKRLFRAGQTIINLKEESHNV